LKSAPLKAAHLETGAITNANMAKKSLSSKATEYLYARYIAGDSARERTYEEEGINAEIARKIYDLRTKAGLTQQELAARVGTTKSAISRLEDADYDGHILSMLNRIAEVLDKRVQIRFVSARNTRVT
jgi:DNA-binding XRE family transcriptional regulator